MVQWLLQSPLGVHIRDCDECLIIIALCNVGGKGLIPSQRAADPSFAGKLVERAFGLDDFAVYVAMDVIDPSVWANKALAERLIPLHLENAESSRWPWPCNPPFVSYLPLEVLADEHVLSLLLRHGHFATCPDELDRVPAELLLRPNVLQCLKTVHALPTLHRAAGGPVPLSKEQALNLLRDTSEPWRDLWLIPWPQGPRLLECLAPELR